MDTSWARNQTAVYWARLGPDGYGGWLFDDPVEIDVRWDEKQELIRSPSGEEVASKAQVLVDQDMDVGDYLMLGSIDDWTSSASAEPLSREKAYPILRMDKIPNVAADFFVRIAWL